MSPAPARTSKDAILVSARRILEEDGVDALTMQRVAERVGIRGPSLYKHVANRAALIRAVGDAVTLDLGRVLASAMSSGDPEADLRSMAGAYRAFVHANPNGYGLLFTHLAPDQQPDQAALAEVGRPIIRAAQGLAGGTAGDDADDALADARTVAAWAHGFVSMELAGAFRLGGDVDAAYAQGIESIIAGISARARRGPRSRRRG